MRAISWIKIPVLFKGPIDNQSVAVQIMGVSKAEQAKPIIWTNDCLFYLLQY